MRPCGDFKFAIASSTAPDLLGFSEDRSIRDRVARALDLSLSPRSRAALPATSSLNLGLGQPFANLQLAPSVPPSSDVCYKNCT